VPGYTVSSNDGPLGALKAESHRLPREFFGGWQDLNTIGTRGGGSSPNISYTLLWVLGPVLYSKFYAPVALLILGLGAWTFFRAMKFAPLACVLGGLAAMLNSGFFSVACWGIAAHTITVGMSFFALAALADTTSPRRWVRVALAGLAVGMGVCEGADVGAMFSGFAALFVIYQAWSSEGPVAKRLSVGFARVAVVALLAFFLAAQAVSGLVAFAITGAAGTQQDKQSRAARWDFATQWSLPKKEALAMLIPGLFGYRMDTPKDMSGFESAYAGGMYWGAVGRDPSLSRAFETWLAEGKQGPPPDGGWRFTGGGNYPGILVLMVAVWACAQSFRKEKSVFTALQRKYIWFWLALAIVSLLLGFGRFAPFYQFFYAIPYASTIRNPAKFIHIVNWSVVILFGFGVHGLARAYLETAVAASKRLQQSFDRKWLIGCGIFLGLSVFGWIVYAQSQPKLEEFLGYVGLGGSYAKPIASFSLGEVGWYVLFLALATVLIGLICLGKFAGPKAKLGGILLGILLVADLGRANQPWIIVWNYGLKYASNPIIDFLRQKPYEHRVVVLPALLPRIFRVPDQLAAPVSAFQSLYGLEWAQHVFPYYNVQSLDIVQMPRVPEDLDKFERAFQPRQPQNQNDTARFVNDFLRLSARKWQITNTRYLLGLGGFVEVLNKYADPAQQRFRIAQQFNLEQKPGTMPSNRPEEWTAAPAPTNGLFALIEFTGALPRAKLYSDWQINTNADATLERLTSADFDPAKTVFVSEPVPLPPPANSTNQNPGSVEFVSYDPNHLVLRVTATIPSILLLNDRFDPTWKLWVDGKSATILHGNFIMRAVQIAPGTHTLEFRFVPPMRWFYVSLAAEIIGLGLLAFLGFSKPKPVADEKPLAKSNAPAGTKK
jgi:hypothetical protein